MKQFIGLSPRGPQAAFEDAQAKISAQSEKGRGNRSRENQLIVHHGEAAKDEFAQPPGADSGGNRRNADGENSCNANSGEKS